MRGRFPEGQKVEPLRAASLLCGRVACVQVGGQQASAPSTTRLTLQGFRSLLKYVPPSRLSLMTEILASAPAWLLMPAQIPALRLD